MKKNILLFVFVCLVDLFFNVKMIANNFYKNKTDLTSLVSVNPPIVTSPIYLCQNSTASPLTATPSVLGNTLIWYGTNATGGVGSALAPIPSTLVVGSTSYYVSETDGVSESTRSRIVVNIVADNGATILNLRCDPTQILAGDKSSSVFFDWSNNPLISNVYNFTYTVNGGLPLSGQVGVSHFQVFGMSPGQSATFTLSSATHPCVPAQTITCSVPCGTATTTPDFPAIASMCEGTIPAPVLGSTSPNGITGIWSPAVVNTTTPGTTAYIFTPNPATFPCALPQTLNVTIIPKATPVFNSIPSTVCQGATAPVLPSTSNNTTPITGSWTPSTVNTAILGAVTYTFTPNPGQCVVTTPTTATITVLPNGVNPNFAPISPICIGSNPPTLSTVSPAGIVGTWSPSTISTTAAGTSSYTFTPDPNQCAVQQTLSVTITPKTVTNFTQIAPFCAGSTAPTLGTTSPNGVSGSWSPTVVDNMASGTYIFTPNSNECATVQTMNIIVNQSINPGFNDYTICSGSVAPNLDTTSPYGVTGTWNPSAVDNLNSDSYTFTPDPGQCAVVQTIDVTVLPSNTLVDFSWTVSDAFDENQKITITADAANGDYSYQLDDGPLQSSPVFEYVSSGLHSVTVVENSGCSNPITKTDILVINYPKYFTPNNDGYNDYWNIKELASQPYAYIRIFDRYGKFLKQISPNGTGWNGTYNGHFLPADDYWFVIHYMENDVVKEFKSHFALKR